MVYGNKLYSKAEQNYCVTRKELLAIVYFTKLYKHYLLGRRFKIRTEHAALQWLKKTPKPIGQQSRWLEQLEAFDFSIEHRAGKKHQNADSMSRIPCQQCRRTDDEVDVVQFISHAHESDLQDNFWFDKNIAKLQENNLDVGEFYKLKKSNEGQKPDWTFVQGTSETTKTLWNMWDDTTLRNGILYRRTFNSDNLKESWQMIAPSTLRLKITEMAHTGMTGGHLGYVKRTKEQVRRKTYLSGWSKFVEAFC